MKGSLEFYVQDQNKKPLNFFLKVSEIANGNRAPISLMLMSGLSTEKAQKHRIMLSLLILGCLF